ncbi:MAG: hypothetical protein Terrestrivirus5_115 [Terrestrivirus sp.]|uniref:Uncharacterized protein n=1 Tax=Terrestrivirus sp. TaxID=2487775 RepID=A0A3G4ZRS2_9VIRU|nr:MAG: hypothetical protein Terrestrivirus5_115 [Terrestrivirus sp.]
MFQHKYLKYKKKYIDLKGVEGIRSILHGGKLTENNILSLITSIGFEFETAQISPIMVTNTKHIVPFPEVYRDPITIYTDRLDDNIDRIFSVSYDTSYTEASGVKNRPPINEVNYFIMGDVAKINLYNINRKPVYTFDVSQENQGDAYNNRDMYLTHTEFHITYLLNTTFTNSVLGCLNDGISKLIDFFTENDVDKLNGYLLVKEINGTKIIFPGSNNGYVTTFVKNNIITEDEISEDNVIMANEERGNNTLGFFMPYRIENIPNDVKWVIQMTFGLDLINVIIVMEYLASDHHPYIDSFSNAVSMYMNLMTKFYEFMLMNNLIQRIETKETDEYKNMSNWFFLVIYFFTVYKGDKKTLYFALRHQYCDIFKTFSDDVKHNFIIFLRKNQNLFNNTGLQINNMSLYNFLVHATAPSDPEDIIKTDVKKFTYDNYGDKIYIELRGFNKQLQQLTGTKGNFSLKSLNDYLNK